jgi:hypothetical protein
MIRDFLPISDPGSPIQGPIKHRIQGLLRSRRNLQSSREKYSSSKVKTCNFSFFLNPVCPFGSRIPSNPIRDLGTNTSSVTKMGKYKAMDLSNPICKQVTGPFNGLVQVDVSDPEHFDVDLVEFLHFFRSNDRSGKVTRIRIHKTGQTFPVYSWVNTCTVPEFYDA